MEVLQPQAAEGALREGDGAYVLVRPWSALSTADATRSANEIAGAGCALHSAINFAPASGMSTALLLLFAGGFYRIQHLYGAGLLFGIATALVGGSLFQFYREIRIGLQELRRPMPFKNEEDGSSRKP